MTANEPGNDPVVITREFAAPARLLFLAYSSCEHMSKWFGSVGWPVTMCEMDFRVGGRWRMAMTGPSGVPNTPFGGTYLEIVPDKRIVFDNGFEAPGAGRMVMTVTFDERPAQKPCSPSAHSLARFACAASMSAWASCRAAIWDWISWRIWLRGGS